ncbi:MAG: hypothetical protein V2A76_06305 [Planctomycetota bacterium]
MADADETLVARLQEGRIDAFRTLYDRHQRALLGLATIHLKTTNGNIRIKKEQTGR